MERFLYVIVYLQLINESNGGTTTNMQKKRFLKSILVTSLCATIGFSALAFGSATEAKAATPASKKIISSGQKYLGVPYRFGAPSGITYAFDCSSFIQHVFKKNGVTLPRTTTAQAVKGQKVAKGSLSMGDLVFFKTNGRSISHVAIYAGNNKILHSSSSKGVTIADLSTNYWKTKYVTARRVLN
jgi:cell wall-associated NlpC family hydrolase